MYDMSMQRKLGPRKIEKTIDRLLKSFPEGVIGKQKDAEIVGLSDLFYANHNSRKGF